MSDTPLFGPDDRSDDVEALLREIDDADLELTPPPADVWAGIEAAIGQEEDQRANVRSIGRRRPMRDHRILAAAAVVAFVVAGVLVVNAVRGGGGAETVATATLAHDAEFDPIGADSAATAELIDDGGTYRIRLDDTSLPTDLGEPADLELWLIAADDAGNITDIASVALVDGAGTYDVPDGIDVSTHRIVDISIEPRDDDPTHSSRSILRGVLSA